MLWWEMESWPTKKWGIGEKRLRTPALEHAKSSAPSCSAPWSGLVTITADASCGL